jgi:hypothetical protein
VPFTRGTCSRLALIFLDIIVLIASSLVCAGEFDSVVKADPEVKKELEEEEDDDEYEYDEGTEEEDWGGNFGDDDDSSAGGAAMAASSSSGFKGYSDKRPVPPVAY